MPSSSHPGPIRTRQRAKRACEICKLRKRKCDGQDPCSYCLRYEYQCSFDSSPRKNAALPAPSEVNDQPSFPPVRGTDVNQAYMEANSGTAFPHLLGMRLNSHRAPKIDGLSWNLGPREHFLESWINITDLISKEEMEGLAHDYFEKLHPVYAVLDPDDVRQKIEARWQSPATVASYDPVLCGVAALGSLFSGRGEHAKEDMLVKCAKEKLEATDLSKLTLSHHAAAWILRTIYLRSTHGPHDSWMASNTTMHIIEAIGAHQDSESVSLVYADTASSSPNVDSQRRLFWTATILNAWISYEYGRSRVLLRGVSCKTPSFRKNDGITELISLYRISERLDPDRDNTALDLEETLTHLEGLAISYDALVLSQSNIALTIYRRLRVMSASLSNDLLARIIRLGNTGLDAASRLAADRSPWWHVANLPFQFLCILLAMDTRESLLQVGPALRAFRAIAQNYSTSSIQKALGTIESLVDLSQAKKERDSAILKDSVSQGRALADFNAVNPQSVDMESWPGLTDTSMTLDAFDLDWDLFLDQQPAGFD